MEKRICFFVALSHYTGNAEDLVRKVHKPWTVAQTGAQQPLEKERCCDENQVLRAQKAARVGEGWTGRCGRERSRRR